MTNFSEGVKCYKCGNTETRINTVIVETDKGRFRLCRNCYFEYESKKVERDAGTNIIGVSKKNFYRDIKLREDFAKKIKGGAFGG